MWVEPLSDAELTIVVDNKAREGLEEAWGLSILVRAGELALLFDTGPDPGPLKANAERLGVDLSSVGAVFISHDHWDHAGGLSLLEDRGLEVYVPEGADPGFKRGLARHFKVREVGGPAVVGKGLASSGDMYGPPHEHALGIHVGGKGLVVVTGCSHPGVENMVSRLVEATGVPAYAVIGGFHLIGATDEAILRVAGVLRDLGVKEVYPLHCTGDRAQRVLKEALGPLYREGYAGLSLRF